MDTKKFLAQENEKVKLADFETDYTGKIKSKKEAEELLEANIKKMRELQSKLYASDRFALLLVFQAMDAAGKDGTIKRVMSGLNPQGTQVFSFKQPSLEEMDHGYLWRINKALPERGRIGIFNRSHYEEVLVVRVHNYLKSSRLPENRIDKNIWSRRFEQINGFEEYLYENGIIPVKFFLHISKDEQKKRFISRIDDPSKNWKFSKADIEERKYWDDYQKCYEEVINNTSKKHSPWYIIPSDKKWFARLLVSQIIIETLESLNLDYPKLSKEQLSELEVCKESLLNEK
ncbi:MAG: polyphosphate kinase 2 family protein [Ignavibacteriales bacterium]|nr:MAG: polyphosphate kinase 2 family protein [Ignavibacteriales bacterium]